MSKWLIKKSRKVEYVNANMREDRVSLPKSGIILDSLDDDDENVYMTSIHDRYSCSPDSLDDMCLAKFAVSYEPHLSTSMPDDDEMPDHNSSHSGAPRGARHELIQLKKGMGCMRKQGHESILRVTSYKVATEPEKFYHA